MAAAAATWIVARGPMISRVRAGPGVGHDHARPRLLTWLNNFIEASGRPACCRCCGPWLRRYARSSGGAGRGRRCRSTRRWPAGSARVRVPEWWQPEASSPGLQVRGHGLGRLGGGAVRAGAVGVDQHLVVAEPVGVGEEQVQFVQGLGLAAGRCGPGRPRCTCGLCCVEGCSCREARSRPGPVSRSISFTMAILCVMD